MTRFCGDCQLCCKLMPVADIVLQKAAGVRCDHQRHHKGCAVYGSKDMPPSCRLWNCAWLVQEDTVDLRRPDRSHYVIDVMPDYITLVDNETGEQTNQPVVQIWIDPNHPDAHRDPALRAWLDARGTPALVRFDSKRAFSLFPPSVATDGQWHEIHTNSAPEGQHSAAAIRKVLDEVDQLAELTGDEILARVTPEELAEGKRILAEALERKR